MPHSVASAAVLRAARSTSSSSNDAAWPRGMGSTVLKPCTTSRAKSSGMPAGLSSTAMRCSSSRTAGSTMFMTDPRRPARISFLSFSMSPRPSSWLSCPTLSSNDMRDNMASMRSSSPPNTNNGTKSRINVTSLFMWKCFSCILQTVRRRRVSQPLPQANCRTRRHRAYPSRNGMCPAAPTRPKSGPARPCGCGR